MSTLTNNQPPTPTAWSSPGPAAFDFRSDVVTTPTPAMLTAITSCTLLDDVFHADPTTNDLEARLSHLTAFPASLLVLSGTMGNQLALRAHLAAPPHSILTDHRAHILEWEAGGAAVFCGALVKGVIPAGGEMLTLGDVRREAVLSEDVHACPTRLVSVENTLGGCVLPLEECQRIGEWAREKGIPVHCDGARLWEAVVADVARGEHGGDLVEGLRAYCQCFDSVSLCFSKGLGAPIGSMLCGSEGFIKKARHLRKSIGGGLRQAGVVSAAARVAVEETFLKGYLSGAQERARVVARMWEERGGVLGRKVETNMVWLDLEKAGWDVERFVEVGVRHGVTFLGGRLVVHYQISDEALERLGRVFDEILLPKPITNGTHEEKQMAENILKNDME